MSAYCTTASGPDGLMAAAHNLRDALIAAEDRPPLGPLFDFAAALPDIRLRIDSASSDRITASSRNLREAWQAFVAQVAPHLGLQADEPAACVEYVGDEYRFADLSPLGPGTYALVTLPDGAPRPDLELMMSSDDDEWGGTGGGVE